MFTTNGGLTTNALLKSIKRRAMIPDNQNTFTDQDFIDLMNEEMMIGLVPSILQMKEEYFIFKEVVPLVSDKSNYPIPERALASKLRELCFRDTPTGLIANEYEMTQIAVDDRYTGLMGNDVILHPSVGPAAYGALTFYYYIRPNSLVKDSEVATIVAVDRVNGILTLSSIPNGYTTSTSANEPVKYDFVRSRSGHNILDIDINLNSINSSTKTVTLEKSKIPKDLEVGDYLALAGQTCIPNIPTELHMILAQRVAQRLLEAIGDTEGLNNATSKIAEMESKLTTMIDNRVEGAPRKIVNRALMTGVARNRRR
jgi:hypothetical protein